MGRRLDAPARGGSATGEPATAATGARERTAAKVVSFIARDGTHKRAIWDRLGCSFLGGLTVKEIAVASWREAGQDDILGSAAQLSFYFFLALFPFLIFLTSVAAFLPTLIDTILTLATRIMPAQATALVHETLRDAQAKRGGGLLSIGLLTSLWAASTGAGALIDSLNRAYEVREKRPFWKVQVTALSLTLAISVLGLSGALLIMFGDRGAAWLGAGLQLNEQFRIVWHAVHYLLGFALFILGLEVAYHFGPDVRRHRRLISPGTIFATAAGILFSLLFSIYLRFAPSYSITYGSLGAVAILMLWLYLIGLAILFGAEINGETAKALRASQTARRP
jgi:membrane protein